MQTSGYRVENSNTLDLRDLHVAERSHQNHNLGLSSAPPASSSNGLYMASKFLPGPSQLFPTDNTTGHIDTHPSAEHSYYPRSTSYGHPPHTNSADFGSRFGSHHQQFLPHSETLTPSTSQAFHTNPLPETSWTSSGIAANSAGQANPTLNEIRYSANHKNTHSSGYPVSAFTPPLTGREGFRSFGSSAHPGDNPSLYLSTAADEPEQSGPSSVPFDHYGRLQAPHPFPSPNHLPLNSTYRSNSTSAPNDYPSSVVDSARPLHLSAEATRASGHSGVQLGNGSKADEPSHSLESSHPEMNPFPEYGEESRKRMRYMDEAITQGGHSKDYPGDKGPQSNKRERKGPNQSISIPSAYNMSNGLPTTFEHPGSATSNSFPIHPNSAPMQTPYNAGSRFLHHQSPPSSSRSDQFVNAPNFHPDYMPNAGLNMPNRGSGTDPFLHEARSIADRFHREMSALLARTPSSLLNQVVRAEDENSTPLEYARRVIDEVKRVSSVLISASPGLAVNTMHNKYQAGQGPSPINPSPLNSFVNHSMNPSPMLSGEPWRPATSNGQMDSYTPTTAGQLPTPGSAGFPPQNATLPFNNNGQVSGVAADYAEGGRWSQMPPPPPSFVPTEHGPYGDSHRSRGSTNLQPPADNASTISSTRTPISASATAPLPTAGEAGTSTSPNDRGSSRRNLGDEVADSKEDSQESERTDSKSFGTKVRSRRQPNGPWREDEAEKLKRLAEESKGKNPNIAPDEIDWDFVVTGFENTRTRHQILIKAVYLGIRATTTHQSRLVRQKQYHGKEQAIPGLTPAKLRQYLDERREEEHDMEVLGIDKDEAASRRKQLKAKRKKAELEAEIQAKAENGYVASGISEPGSSSFSNVLNQEQGSYPPHAHPQAHWHGHP